MEGAAGAEKFGVLRVSRGKTVILEKNRGFPTQLSVPPPLISGKSGSKGGGHLVGIVLITSSDPPFHLTPLFFGARIQDFGDLEGSGPGRLRRPEKIVFLMISRGKLVKISPPAAEKFAFWSSDFDDF